MKEVLSHNGKVYQLFYESEEDLIDFNFKYWLKKANEFVINPKMRFNDGFQTFEDVLDVLKRLQKQRKKLYKKINAEAK